MASVWTYSDWITYDEDSSTRLTRLRLHIQEVSDFLSTGDYNINGRSVDKSALQGQLKILYEKEEEESKKAGSTNGKRHAFTRGRATF